MRKCAFFDMDGTIINIKSMFSFIRFYWSHNDIYGKAAGEEKYQQYETKVKNDYLKGESRKKINIDFYKNFAGHEVSLINKLSHEWWRMVLTNKNLFQPKALELIKLFQKENTSVILVSGSMSACTNHIKNYLKISHSLNTCLEEMEGKYTGEIKGEVMIGEGKSHAIRRYSLAHKINLNESFSYGDDVSDIPMMKTTKYKAAINPEKKLKKHALKNHWEIITN